jgi:hypothetical protein
MRKNCPIVESKVNNLMQETPMSISLPLEWRKTRWRRAPLRLGQRRGTGRFRGAMQGLPALEVLLVFEEFFAAGQALGDLEGLALGAHGGGVGGQVAGGSD